MPSAETVLFEREVELEERELARLVELLADEQRVLSAHEDELLLGIAAEKAQRLATLERLSARRNTFLAREDLRPDSGGMLDWLSAHPECTAAARAWQRLEQATRTAREANEINGRLIASRMQGFQRRLAFFQSKASNDSTYSPEGYPRPGTAQRTYGEA